MYVMHLYLVYIYATIISDSMSDDSLVPDEFMNSKKAHEVPAMAKVVAALSRCCKVKQVRNIL